jgi:hypothetical protein
MVTLKSPRQVTVTSGGNMSKYANSWKSDSVSKQTKDVLNAAVILLSDQNSQLPRNCLVADCVVYPTVSRSLHETSGISCSISFQHSLGKRMLLSNLGTRCLSSKTPIRALWAQPVSIQWVLWAFSSGLKWPEREADSWYPQIPKFLNHRSIPPLRQYA